VRAPCGGFTPVTLIIKSHNPNSKKSISQNKCPQNKHHKIKLPLSKFQRPTPKTTLHSSKNHLNQLLLTPFQINFLKPHSSTTQLPIFKTFPLKSTLHPPRSHNKIPFIPLSHPKNKPPFPKTSIKSFLITKSTFPRSPKASHQNLFSSPKTNFPSYKNLSSQHSL